MIWLYFALPSAKLGLPKSRLRRLVASMAPAGAHLRGFFDTLRTPCQVHGVRSLMVAYAAAFSPYAGKPRPRRELPLWGSCHGNAVTERVILRGSPPVRRVRKDHVSEGLAPSDEGAVRGAD